MDIRKSDSKGRVSIGTPDKHYYVEYAESGIITLKPVPEMTINVFSPLANEQIVENVRKIMKNDHRGGTW